MRRSNIANTGLSGGAINYGYLCIEFAALILPVD